MALAATVVVVVAGEDGDVDVGDVVGAGALVYDGVMAVAVDGAVGHYAAVVGLVVAVAGVHDLAVVALMSVSKFKFKISIFLSKFSHTMLASGLSGLLVSGVGTIGPTLS